MVPLPEGLGALKVTTALFFRPGGRSTQHTGVASDVIIPSIFGTDDFGEAHQTYSLPTQSITSFLEIADTAKADGPAWQPITPALIQELALRSNKRVETNEDLIKIRERIAKTDERNGVVHLAELMKEQEEEEAAEKENKDGEPAAEESENAEAAASSSGDKTNDLAAADTQGSESEDSADASDEDPPSPQQLEAVQILADLIQLTS
jgi:carboxyl-terminal processing protease